jgi:hypothetical protein
MTNEIAKTSNGQLEAKSPVAQPASIPNAVGCIMEGLKEAITAMKADDVSVELSANQEGARSSASFRIRAYRNGRKVVDQSRDEDDLERE